MFRGFFTHRRSLQAASLCRLAQKAQRSDPSALPSICRRLVETLSDFGWEDPGAKIRARTCGCPIGR